MTRGGYLTGLDGLRALAVIAVLLYHAGLLRGGFLGVEVFFVISGYLITSLLLREWQSTSAIDVGAFWLRRARRLLPASVLTVLAVNAVAVVALSHEIAALRGATLAALLSVSNWYSIFNQQSYFEAIGRPPLLQHYWSLAIEAQFYLAWPLILLFGLRHCGRRRLLVATALIAAASAMWMAGLYRPEADPSRIYFGTDTRLSGLLLGSALALAAPRWRWRARLLDGLGGLALLGLAVLCLALGEYEPALYRGGFALVGALSAIVIFATPGWLGTHLLESKPLRWLGVRSYGVYLWHWPVFMLTRPGIDVFLDGWVVMLARLLIVGVLADFSYRWVERPWRSGVPRFRWAIVVVCMVVLGGSVAAARPPERPAYLPTDAVDTWTDVTSTPVQVEVEVEAEVVAQTVAAEAPQEVVSPTPVASPRVTAIGDSVMLGSVGGLEATIDGIEVDAAISRQVAACIDILRTRAAAGQLGDVVVVHIGNNGTFTTAQFDEMMGLLAAVRRVVIVNLRVPRAWETANNAVLADGVARYSNTVLIDWHGASSQRPELFWADGMHLRPEGALVYAQLIAEQVLSTQ